MRRELIASINATGPANAVFVQANLVSFGRVDAF
jgi:hypothetical protein